MGNFLRKLMKNTDRIISTQVKNSPDFEAGAARVTGRRKPPKIPKKRITRRLN